MFEKQVPILVLFSAIAILTACETNQPATDADVSDDSDRDIDQSSDAESSCLPDPDGDTTSPDADDDVDRSDSDMTDADVDADEIDSDFDWDADVDSESCPDDMIRVGSYCIDIYEASRSDATATSQGSATGRAFSKAGVIPWHVNPADKAARAEFETACELAGKQLCTAEQWFPACTGPAMNRYVFGNDFDRETCNCVDTFCDDHCRAEGIPEEECVTGGNCGYTYDCFHVEPTGQFPGCTNELGTFDINGNVWEVVLSTEDERGYEIRGGAFNCASASSRLECTYNADWIGLYAGFRCCL